MSLVDPELGEVVADEASLVVALLRKFVLGSRLRGPELDVLSRIVPRCTKARWRRCYTLGAEDYGRLYDASPRTVKWWKARGDRHPGGPLIPPLDTPALMPDWWARVMTQRCPDNILHAARAAGWAVRPEVLPPALPPLDSPAAQEKSTPTVPAPAGSAAPIIPITAGTAFEDTLSHLRAQVALAHAELLSLQAAKPPDPAAIEQSRRRWITLSDASNKAEAHAPEYFEKMGRLLDRDTLARELTRMLAAVAQHIRGMRRRLAPQIAAAHDEIEAESIWQRGTDEAFAELQRAGYTEPFALIPLGSVAA